MSTNPRKKQHSMTIGLVKQKFSCPFTSSPLQLQPWMGHRSERAVGTWGRNFKLNTEDVNQTLL